MTYMEQECMFCRGEVCGCDLRAVFHDVQVFLDQNRESLGDWAIRHNLDLDRVGHLAA